MDPEEVYGFTREECVRFRVAIASQLRQMFEQPHRFNPSNFSDFVGTIDCLTRIIKKFDAKPASKAKKIGGEA